MAMAVYGQYLVVNIIMVVPVMEEAVVTVLEAAVMAAMDMDNSFKIQHYET